MDPGRNIRNVALVGFMGTGKTSVGHLAAELLHFKFVDTDGMIERRAHLGITEIFASQGEARFRQYEEEVVSELEQIENTVISTGGGLIVNPLNLASLKKHALIVCLWAAPESIYERVRNQSHRPLLQTPNPLEKIRELLGQRESFYRQADVLLNSDLRPLKQVAGHVVHHFRLVQAVSAR